MRIGLDTRNTGRAGGTGVATYAATLGEAYNEAGIRPAWLHDDMATHANVHNFPQKIKRLVRSTWPNSRVQQTGDGYIGHDLYRTAEIRDRTFHRPISIKADVPPDLMHWTYPVPLQWPGIPNVVTIHDIIPLLHPEFSDTPVKRLHRRLKFWCDNADAIVTVSEAVRQDLIHFFGLPPEKISMLSQSVSFPTDLMAEALTVDAPCPKDGFLYFGTIERRKNVGRLIEAHGRSGTTRPLTLIGALGFGGAEELHALKHHPAPERVRILPWCSRPALVRAIREARCVAFPSLAEGFGLPILEAMILGTPVLTSLGHATEEISGTAALLVDSTNVEALAEGIKTLDQDDALWAALSSSGRKRAQDFAIEPYARRMKKFYQTLLDG